MVTVISNEKQQAIAQVKQMMSAPSCYAGLKAKAQTWIDSIGKPNEKAAAQDMITEIEASITPIDGLVAFAHSDNAKEIFGAEGATKFAAHADELKASGAKYCDCQACAAGLAVLDLKAAIL